MKILYIDMDNVLADFNSGIQKLDDSTIKKYEGILDDVPGIFSKMEPMPGAIEAFKKLTKHFEVYILSTSPWNNPSAWRDKLEWVQKYLPEIAEKRLILTHHKHLNQGDYIIDDRTKHGVDRFKGEHIHFGQKGFETWEKVIKYLFEKEQISQLKG